MECSSSLRRRCPRHKSRKKWVNYSGVNAYDVDWILASRARGEYLRTHFKNMREVAAALSGEPIVKRIHAPIRG